MTAVVDQLGRPLRSLRISVTDRCNLRCRYCMPEADYTWLPRESILSFEEIARLAGIFTRQGVVKVRLTGGEPLLRRDLPTLVRLLRGHARIADIALTTNGTLLAESAPSLRQAGLDRITVSLDTLRPERLLALSRTNRHGDILSGIAAARNAGFAHLKINSVVMRGFNDDEVTDLLEYARGAGAEVRFIEYMDVGGATQWSRDQVVTARDILESVRRRYGAVERLDGERRTASPAMRFRLPDGTTFGIIASVTAPFCGTCDRARLTADGTWLLCLYATGGTDLREPLRAGATDEQLASLIASGWRRRTDRGAEDRLAIADRGVLYSVAGLQADPHREMHTRGG